MHKVTGKVMEEHKRDAASRKMDYMDEKDAVRFRRNYSTLK